MTAFDSVRIKLMSGGVLTGAVHSRGKILSLLPLYMPFLIMLERLFSVKPIRNRRDKAKLSLSVGLMLGYLSRYSRKGSEFTPAALGPLLLCCVLLPSRAQWSEVHLKIFLLVLHMQDKGNK